VFPEVEPEELDNAGLTATATPVTCSGNGQIELAVDGAIEDFLFSIEPSANIESTAPNLFTEVPTGFYQVTATSANNPLCTQTIDVEVRQDTLDSVTATPTPIGKWSHRKLYFLNYTVRRNDPIYTYPV